MDLKVITHARPTMFLFFNRIYVTSEYLTVTSDACLESAIWHEYGHKEQFKFMFCITLISMVIFLQLVLMLSSLGFLVLPFFYLLVCWFCRLGEYHSDVFSLKHTTLEGVLEMLQGEGSRLDTRLSMLFYPLRWHPCSSRRINNIFKTVKQ